MTPALLFGKLMQLSSFAEERTTVDSCKVGVIGVGHLGRCHARAYAQMPEIRLVGLVDVNPTRAKELAQELGIPAMADLDELLSTVNAVSVAVPTSEHHRIAKRCLERGVHVLVEKPIATTLEEADDLIASAQQTGVVLQVGHIERFNAAFRAISELNLTPMFIESHRLAPYTPRGADVAVILDLMIHDIDLTLALIKAKVSHVLAVGVAVVSDSEDIANARVTFSNGTVANLTTSRISPRAMRKMRLFQRDAYISADFLNHSVDIYRLQSRGTGDEKGDHPLGSSAQTALLSRGQFVVCERPKLEQEDALTMELRAFLCSIRKGEKPLVSGQDGREALALALKIMKCLQEHTHWIQKTRHP